MDKLISQQAAIEALNTQAEEMSHWSERYQEQRRGVLTAVNIVADCPSVQPNHCAEVGKKVLIDRQEALEAIGTLQTYKLFAGDDMLLIDQAEAQTELMMLPSAEPEREKGEWVYNSPVTMKCNRCGLVIKDWDWHRFKICPNCGADMRGGENDGCSQVFEREESDV